MLTMLLPWGFVLIGLLELCRGVIYPKSHKETIWHGILLILILILTAIGGTLATLALSSLGTLGLLTTIAFLLR